MQLIRPARLVVALAFCVSVLGVTAGSVFAHGKFQVRRLHRLGAFVGLVLALVIAMPAAAASTHTVSTTENFHGSVTSTGVNPCNGGTVDLTLIFNGVVHETYFPASDEFWFTTTEEDKLTAIDEGTGVVYSGHLTNWFGFNLNRQNATTTGILVIHATGSDGSTIALHDVSHTTLLPDGTISVTFDKPTLTCG